MAIGWHLPAKRKYLVPKGLKPVRRKLATGETRVYWYHRATGKRLSHDPETAEGLLEVLALDKRSAALEAARAARSGSYAALWARYRDSPEWRALRPRTRSDYQAVRDWLGLAANQSINALSPGIIFQLRDKAATAKGRRFANYVIQVLRLTLEWGRKRDLCHGNPARDVNLIKRPAGDVHANRAWTSAELEAFASVAPRQMLVPFALGLFAGLRQGDALLVTWRAYDGATLRWIAGKNGQPCAAPVTGPFKIILDAAKESRGETLQIATTAYGSAWTASGFRASFFKLVRKLVAEGKMETGCTFHGLRHTIATHARDAGESESRVAAGIGDRSTAMAAVYGRDADRFSAQSDVLEGVQKRFENNDWKTDWKTPAKAKA